MLFNDAAIYGTVVGPHHNVVTDSTKPVIMNSSLYATCGLVADLHVFSNSFSFDHMPASLLDEARNLHLGMTLEKGPPPNITIKPQKMQR